MVKGAFFQISLWGAVCLALVPMAGAAQLMVDVTDDSDAKVRIAIPAFATDQNVPTPAGPTEELRKNVAQIITEDLRGSGVFDLTGPSGLRGVSIGAVTSPQYPVWSGYDAVIHGFVKSAGSNSDLSIGCYLFDVPLKSELTHQVYTVPVGDWRRAAHKCADMIYSRLTGESPFFNSRIAYIAESGSKGERVKRLAIMDSDGGNHRFITSGQAIALTPRFSPDYKSILYVGYLNGRVRIFVYDIAANKQRLITESSNPTFAPRWSPDGRWILFSMAIAGNTDIYKMPVEGGAPVRLTSSPGIDVGGSFSPDGTKIVFESDRSGSQQIYVMNADGSDQQRISHGGGRYATPEWSPRGDLIAFTKIAGDFKIAVMTPAGENERILTNGWQDEAPTWAPNGRVLQFFRSTPGRDGVSAVWQVDVTGASERRIPTPLSGSDPAWGALLP